jgi:hypothetical protein
MVTREDLNKCHMRQTMRGHGPGMFFSRYRCVEHPRLSRHDHYEKKDRSVKSTFMVDGAEVADIEAAVVALNIPVVITPEEQAMLDTLPTEWTEIRSLTGKQRRDLLDLADKGLIEYRQFRRAQLSTVKG